MRRTDVLHLKEPISLRAASRQLGGTYMLWRKAAMAGRIRAQQLGGFYWFIELADAKKLAPELKRRARA